MIEEFLRENFIRLAILYGIECWGVKKQYIHKMSVLKLEC